MELRNEKNISLDELSEILDNLPEIKLWIKAIEDRALNELQNGNSIPNYELGKGRSLRQWVNNDEIANQLKENGLTDDQIYQRKLISPAQADKLLDNNIVVSYVEYKEGKPTIRRIK